MQGCIAWPFHSAAHGITQARVLHQRIIDPYDFNAPVLSRYNGATLRARPNVPVNNNTTGYGAKQMNSNSTRLSSRFAGLHAQASLSTLAADEMSDAELIQQIAVADERAMQVFYERHYQSVYRLVSRTLHSTQSAEDIASDVFLDVWSKAGSFEGRSEVGTWLFAIARNKSISVRRQRSSDPWDDATMESIEDDADGPELRLHKQSTDSTVRKCLDRLSPAHRVVIDLVYFHDNSIDDAARAVGIARNTVKTRLFYARKQLSELLGAQGIVTASA